MGKPTVIGLDYTPAYEQGGGIGRYVRELVGALVYQDRETDYRLFVSGASLTTLPSQLAINFTWKPTWVSPTWLARLWYRAGIKFPVEAFTGRVDLYHATDFVLPPTLSRTRTLLTVHDLSFIRVPESASPNLKSYLDSVVPRSVASADRVLADSQATKDDLVDLYGLSERKITVLLSGVDSRFHLISDANLLMTTRIKYGLDNSPYIFAVGTLQPRKNYGRLIVALAQLRAIGYDLKLVIAGGKGWLEDPIYQTLHDEQMENHVRFIGFAAEEDLPALYSGAFCLAFPSLYEGFGLPVLEAMACGTPVVTSNVSSLPEVAGDAALMVNPHDLDELVYALRQLLDDEGLRQKLIHKGFERAKLFTWEKSAHQLREIYAELLA